MLKKILSGKNRSVNIGTSTKDPLLRTYLRDIHKTPILSPREQNELALRAKKGDKRAKDALIKTNLRFVVSMARKFAPPNAPHLPDLINEGNIGLIEAVKKYDPAQGYHFTSYAVWWIRKQILLAIEQKFPMIRLPMNKVTDLRRIQSVYDRFLSTKDQAPTIEEIALELDKDNKWITKLTLMSKGTLSLDEPFAPDQEQTWEDILIDHREDPQRTVLNNDLFSILEGALHTALGARESQVVCLRHGIDLSYEELVHPHTLQEVSYIFKVSRERIRQIEDKGLGKLKKKKTKKIKALKIYLDEQ